MTPPSDWPATDPTVVAEARERVRSVLLDETRSARDLALYYDPDGDYAGPIFDNQAGSSADDITADDLLAITAMQVSASPRALGRFLTNVDVRAELRQALADTPNEPLWEAAPDGLQAMDTLYQLVKRQFSDGNMWVSATKLCARKRPRLVPVRDSVIVTGLGLPNRDFRQDSLIIGAIMDDPDVRLQLRRCAEIADPDHLTILAEVAELRLLDAILWMRWSRGGRDRGVEEQ